MIFAEFKDFVAQMPPVGRLMGVDWGKRRIGVALSDARREFVFPRGVIENAKGESAIIEITNSEKPVGIVVGMPRHADGTDSETTVAVRKFAEELSAATDMPITFTDERLTSAEAGERTGGDKKSPIDDMAAAVILEDAIAMIKRMGK